MCQQAERPAKFSGHKKAIAIPGRERINNQWVPQTRLPKVFIWKEEGCEEFLSGPETPGTEQTLVRILTFG